MTGAVLSPDGHTVAFNSYVENVPQVFVMLTSGGEPLQLTNDEGAKAVDNFSTDGTEIFYRRNLGRDEVWAVPTLGGKPRRLISGIRASQSPDGKSIYYTKSGSRILFRSDATGLQEEQVVSLEKYQVVPFSILWYADGKRFLILAGGPRTGTTSRLFEFRLSDANLIERGEITDTIGRATWLERDRSIIFGRMVNGIVNLWKYDLDSKALAQITTGTGPDANPMTDPAGRGIYYVNGRLGGSLAVYDVKTGTNRDVITESASQPIISPDQSRIMYVKFASAKRELWVSGIDGSNQVKIAEGISGTGDWSHDSSQITFTSRNDQGISEVYVSGADGRGLRSVKPGIPQAVNAFWSPDGKTIFIVTNNGSKSDLWIADIGNLQATKFIENVCSGSDISVDGKYVVGSLDQGDDIGIYSVSLAEKKQISLLPGVETFSVRFSKDGKSILYAVAEKGQRPDLQRSLERREIDCCSHRRSPTSLYVSRSILMETLTT